jgi:hypothetical protein
MNTIPGLLAEPSSTAEQGRVTPIRESSPRKALVPITSVHGDQVHALVQQLFFRYESNLIRHVGFAAVETSTETATLCLDVAKALAEQDRYDIGLIDAHPGSISLQTKLRIAAPNRADISWPIGPRLWMVPRQNWFQDECGQRVTDQNLTRLRELTAEFDFSILYCAPASWLTAGIGQACDGIVLVLTANKTRRLVVTQIKDQLNRAEVPLLGSVLTERRFPVPQGLYWSL